MPELPRARHTGPDTLHHLHGGTPAVPQAERRQQKGRGQRKANDRPGRPTREEQGIIRAMTTINNQDDFLEALRNNPQWRDAVRAQILGDDLMELPAKFDAFVEEQKAHNEKLDGFVEKIDAFMEEQRTTHANLDARLDRTDTRLGRIESDTRTMRGYTARIRTIQDAQGIASDMGLEFIRTLSAADLSDMSGNALSRDVGRSFRNADLVIAATDGNDTRYIAMEVSFTADLGIAAGPPVTPNSSPGSPESRRRLPLPA